MIDAPLALHQATVPADWLDYNGHVSEWCYLLLVGDAADAFFRYVGIDEAYRAAGHSLYTAETHLHHLRETGASDQLAVPLHLLDVGPKSLHIFHTVRDVAPHEDLVERLDEVPAELAAQIRGRAIAAGLYAANFPEELGGGGLDELSLTLVERELGWTSYALQWLVARPSNILRACVGNQVESYLLPAIRGERIDCLAMTEPGAGSDIRSMQTRAIRDGAGWVLNRAQQFISYADIADFVIVFAVTGTEPSARGERSAISAFLVDHGTPGFTVSRGASSVSHRGYHHCELSFADCRIPGSALLGTEGRGFDLLSEWLCDSRVNVWAPRG